MLLNVRPLLVLSWTLLISIRASADDCPPIQTRIDENATCNPGGARIKDCDSNYKAPSKEWIACYGKVADCRQRIFGQNKAISNHNAMVYKCQASVIAGLLKKEGSVVAHASGTIPGLRQPPGSGTCWATVATMMWSWKNDRSEAIEAVLGRLGPSYVAKFRDPDPERQALDASEKEAFLNEMGLKAEVAQNHTPQGWANLIKQYGPLWITTNEGSLSTNEATKKRFSVHARVLTGIFGDGSLDGTTVVVIDPADGNLHAESLRAFTEKFEDVARIDIGNNGDIRPQVVHY